jgi:Ni,Fe-hydrogenase maturation factor
VIDAVRGGGSLGTTVDIALADVAALELRPVSSHNVSVSEAVALAGELGRLPSRSRFLSVEIAGVPPRGLERGRTHPVAGVVSEVRGPRTAMGFAARERAIVRTTQRI